MFVKFRTNIIILVSSYLLMAVSIFLLFTSIISIFFISKWQNILAFFFPAFFVFIFSLCLRFLVKDSKDQQMFLGRRDVFLIYFISWVMVSVISALPFMFADTSLNFVDALFESVSGLTTTGFTVFAKPEFLGKSILFWRGLLQWVGGIFAIVLAVSLLPFLGVGGMQLFYADTGQNFVKYFHKGKIASLYLVFTYCCISIVCALLLWGSGLGIFDSVVHMMSTVSTGGFSTHSNSISAFNNGYSEVIMMFFMFICSCPFTLLFLFATTGNYRLLLKDDQVKMFAKIFLFFSLIIFLGLILGSATSVKDALRYGLFNLISMLSGTGFTNTDYSGWSSLVLSVLLYSACFGGCAYSSSCGIKMFRIHFIKQLIKNSCMSLLYPQRVPVYSINGKNVNWSTVSSALSIVFYYFVTFIISAIILTFLDIDVVSAFSIVISSLSNVGAGIGSIIGTSGSGIQVFATCSKYLLIFLMIVGRLEFIVIFILFHYRFWKG